MRWIAILVALAGTAAAAPRDYVGAAACGSCHAAALATWQQSAHARAASPAALGNRAGDARCLSCHATGDGASARARLAGVGCEACHGAGAAYSPDDIMRDRALARLLGLRDLSTPELARGMCVRCHEAAGFEYAVEWKRVAH